ncbi:ATP-binding cassette domain-containing protein, partial [Glutamicibacter sp. 363]
ATYNNRYVHGDYWNMNLLEVDQVVVRRGKRFSLSPISFKLTESSGIVGLFGQNGAGKTTLLKAMAGMLSMGHGSVSIAGSNRPVFLPDKPYLYDFLRVSECPELLQRYYSDFSVDIAEEILSDLKLDRSLKLSQLSKGMMEQLSLGMMLARRSNLYLFDEPLAAVDPVTRDLVLELIERHRPSGAAVVISTHLITGLESLFNECLVLHDGKLLMHEKVNVLQNSGGLEETFKKVIRNA